MCACVCAGGQCHAPQMCSQPFKHVRLLACAREACHPWLVGVGLYGNAGRMLRRSPHAHIRVHLQSCTCTTGFWNCFHMHFKKAATSYWSGVETTSSASQIDPQHSCTEQMQPTPTHTHWLDRTRVRSTNASLLRAESLLDTRVRRAVAKNRIIVNRDNFSFF